MRPTHFLLAILLILIWGFNFVVIKTGLGAIPPLTLCFVRFFLTSIPAIFFIKPPKIPYKIIALYGIVMFAIQFSLLFIGIHIGVTAGLASLLVQTHVFFTILLAVFFLSEKPNKWQILGGIIAFCGLILVVLNLNNDKTTSILGFILIIGSAITWGIGNLICKKIEPVNNIALVIWGSLFAWPILLPTALIFEGSDKIIFALTHLTWLSAATILYLVYPATIFGWAIWSWLLGKYSTATIAPFSLLTPIVGMASSALVLGEPFYCWKILAATLVILGLTINLLATKFKQQKILTNKKI